MKKLSEIVEGQKAFQALCDVNIDTILASEINTLSENYLFKAIEEIIELRKTFPSAMNQWAKNQGDENREEIMGELSDVTLFMLNFCLVRKITLEDLLESLGKVQEVNFIKLKQKKLAILKDEMLRVPNKQIGLGGGSLMPAVIIIGQNPGKSLSDDKNCWDNPPAKSAVGFLQRALKLGETRLNLQKDDIYFTNIVKEVTENNAVPTTTMTKFWMPFLIRELNIVNSGTNTIYLTMGKEATQTMMNIEPPREFRMEAGIQPIMHPSYFMRNGFTEKQYYDEQLLPKLRKFDLETESE